MKVYVGSYIGNGESERTIKVPFTPEVILIDGYWKIDAMGTDTYQWDGDGGIGNERSITDIVDYGFKVGSSLNSDGGEVYYVAFASENVYDNASVYGKDLFVGKYLGDGTDDRIIQNQFYTWDVNGQYLPSLSLIQKYNSPMRSSNGEPIVIRDSEDVGDESSVLDGTVLLGQTNLIQNLEFTGTHWEMELGDDTKVNAENVDYFYSHFIINPTSGKDNVITGTYTGDGVDGRILNLDKEIDAIIIFNKTTASDLVLRVKNKKITGHVVNNLYGKKVELSDDDSVNKDGDTYFYMAFQSSVYAPDKKYHVSIDGIGYVLQINNRGRIVYDKKPAPTFINRFGGGDVTYRDGSIWQFWGQVDWRGGCKQKIFDDPTKFWDSENVDVTQSGKLRLSHKLIDTGLVESGKEVTAMGVYKKDQEWWNSNYGYRLKLTITAGADDLPKGMPIKVALDTATLVSGGKMLANRNDLRIVYWNGTDWQDLYRDYAQDEYIYFSLREAIKAGKTSEDYYVYYDYSSESSSMQPTTDGQWLETYGMYGGAAGVALDAYTVSVHHFRDGSGTTITDDDSNLDFTATGVGWGLGVFGRGGIFADDTDKATNTSDTYNLGSMTVEGWVKIDTDDAHQTILTRVSSGDLRQFQLAISGDNKAFFCVDTASAHPLEVRGTTEIQVDTWYHIAGTFESGVLKIYVNGELENSNSNGESVQSMTSVTTYMGRKDVGGADILDGTIAHLRVSNVARTSFPYAKSSVWVITASEGSEEAYASGAEDITMELLAGTNNGYIASWDGDETWNSSKTGLYDTVNQFKLSKIDGSNKLYYVIGDVDSSTDSEAELWEYDGSTHTMTKQFTGAGGDIDSAALCLEEYNDVMFIGVSPEGRIYKTEDMSTFEEATEIKKPENPGFVYALVAYNKLLYAMGGSPEFMHDKNYYGFMHQHDGENWDFIQSFDWTVIRSVVIYDSLVFIGTYHGELYIFNSVTIDSFFNWSEDFDYKLTVKDMRVHKDKLYIATVPQTGELGEGSGVYVFDRRGISRMYAIDGVTKYNCLQVFDNDLFIGCDDGHVYRVDETQYEDSGYLISSFYDAGLSSIKKLYSEFKLVTEPMPAGTSIAVSFRTTDSGDWESLGTINTENAIEKIIEFTNAMTRLSTKVQIKYTLSTDNPLVTPSLDEGVLKYTLYPERKWMWSMRIVAKDNAKLIDNTLDVRKGEQVVSDIEDSHYAQEVNTFIDVDGQEYSVIFTDMDQASWVVNQDSEGNEVVIPITLIEV